MPRISRRQLLAGSVAAGTTWFLGKPSHARVLGANDRVRIAIAGLHGRGQAHLDAYLKMKDVEVAYLIDPDNRMLTGGLKEGVSVLNMIKKAEEKGARRPQMIQDVRKALEDPNLDALSIATPNHWHALMTIWACQAGKDVYCEKPMCHNMREGRVAVEAVKKYNRIVQHGTQRRSDTHFARIMAAIHSGKLGKLQLVRGLCYKRRWALPLKPAATPPPELDFDLWLGPAPQQPYTENLVHYNWHWFWDTGNGDIGNQGVHQTDVGRWGIAGAGLPRTAVSVGGRFAGKDQGQTADTQLALFDFGGVPFIFEVRGLETDKYLGEKITNIFHLEAGTIVETKFFPKGSDQPAPLPEVEFKLGPGGDNNFANFIAAVRSRKQSDLNAPLREGFYASALCHLANASYRLGQQVPFNRKTGAFADNKDASEAFGRMEEHLTRNGLKLDSTEYRLGTMLTVSDDPEAPTDNAAANDLLAGKGQYRAPFVVPEKA